jgi:hypothetical protein
MTNIASRLVRIEIGCAMHGILNMILFLSKKLEKCLVYALCQVNKGKVLFRVRFLASTVGHLISMYAVFGDTVRQSTRFVYDCVWWKASWQGRVVSTQDALNELSFWDKNCRLLNSKGSTISTMTVNTVFDREFFVWRSYLCNQCISPLTLWVRTPRCILYNICDKLCEWLSVGRWFSPSTSASSINRIVESGVKHHKPSQSIARNICINGVFLISPLFHFLPDSRTVMFHIIFN